MRFRIRYADQIVGLLILVALAVLAAVIFLIGSHQRWFARDVQYFAYFDSANGLGSNMQVQYKGFTVGNIKGVRLTEDDRVEAVVAIFEEYTDRMKEGTLVELRVSPIGLGNAFLLYPGLGALALEPGATLPQLGSSEAASLSARGLTAIPVQDDSINLIISRVNTLLADLDRVLREVEDAFAGTSETALGRILGNAETTLAGLPGVVDQLQGTLSGLLGDIQPILGNLETLSDSLVAPEGTVASVLDGQGSIYTSLDASLRSVSGMLRDLERTTNFIPTQLPQIGALVMQLREVLQTVESVLNSLTNNPLLRGGIPDQVKTNTEGTSSRDISF
jgi:phospholipid/cholesterol/gamma-HCH transport system substrate-binding protein